ncbi:MAG: hypothetical protein ABIK84_03420 [candidate division WOR-3 bacterium]
MDGIDPHRRLVPYHYLACKYYFPSCPTFRLANFFLILPFPGIIFFVFLIYKILDYFF